MDAYEKLWGDALAAFDSGAVRVDPHLRDKPNDLRRGVTLVARPSTSVRNDIKDFLDQLAHVCPNQYYYRPEELHLTVLAIISGSVSWQAEARHLDSCRAIIRDVLGHQPPFGIRCRGITASPDAVMIQGFPIGDGLEQIRQELRAAFAREGFDNLLDRRYRISTAHITVMRFSQPVESAEPLRSLLKQSRNIPFGEMEIDNLELILTDWYASADIVQTLEGYRLGKH